MKRAVQNLSDAGAEQYTAMDAPVSVLVSMPLRCVGEGIAALIEKDSCFKLAGLATPQIEKSFVTDLFSEKELPLNNARKVILADPTEVYMAHGRAMAGIAGFVLKSDPWALVREAIYNAANHGSPVFSPDLMCRASDLHASASRVSVRSLSARQREVFS